MPYLGRSSNFGVRTVFQYLPSAGDTSVSGADANGKTLAFADGNYVDVYLNGVKLKTGTDYNTTTANTIAGLTALASNDEVTVVVYDAFSLATGFETLGGTFGDDITFKKDSVVLNFGVDSDVTITHDPDDGLIFKSAATGDDNPFLLTLQTGETDIAANDVLGAINFQAPDEGTGTDAILVAGKIDVLSEGDFSSSSNASSMRFFTGNSAAAGTDGGSMILSSTGNLTLKDLRTADGSSPTITLQSGDTDIAANDVLGTINFQAPDEGTGTDAILVAAGIEAVSEGDFSSSSNATKLVFKTGASAAADSKFEIASDGSVSTPTAGTNNLRLGANAGNSIASGGNENTLIGDEAGTALTTGDQNVAIGFEALKTEDGHGRNTAIGYQALKVLDAGANGFNTAIGYQAGVSINTGTVNTLIGHQAGDALTTGNNNVAVGHEALGAEVQGDQNVAIGVGALQAQSNSSDTDAKNTAVGYNAGLSITTGVENVAIGHGALDANTTGQEIVAIGVDAAGALNLTNSGSPEVCVVGFEAGKAITDGGALTLIGHKAGKSLTGAVGVTIVGSGSGPDLTGSDNTFVGTQSGFEETTGVDNTLIGHDAGREQTGANGNTIVGSHAGSTLGNGSNNTFIGFQAGDDAATNNQCVCVGMQTDPSTNSVTEEITIGVEGTGGGHDTVSFVTSAGKMTAVINGSNTTFSASSDERLKKDIKDSTVGLEFIKELRPVTFKWNEKNAIADSLPQYNKDSSDPVYGDGKSYHGFIAQEVKTVIDKYTDIVDGHNIWREDPDGTQQISPSQLIPMLTKSVQELSAKNDALETENTTQKTQIADLISRVTALEGRSNVALEGG